MQNDPLPKQVSKPTAPSAVSVPLNTVSRHSTPQSDSSGVFVEPPKPPKVKLADNKMLQRFLTLCFQFGFGMVFIINAITAYVDPEPFKQLIESNFLAKGIGHTDLMLFLIIANDLILGALILLGIKKNYTYAWAGVWLFLVTFIKFTALVAP